MQQPAPQPPIGIRPPAFAPQPPQIDDWLTLPRYEVVDLGLPSEHTTTPLFGGPMRHRRSREVNGHGDRVGSLLRGGQERAMFFEDTRVVDLGLLHPGDDGSRALALNDAGQVVGLSRRGLHERAFLWQDGHMIDLGGLCDAGDGSRSSALAGSRARDINNRGQVVGRAVTSQRAIGFVWSFLHGLLDLGALLGETGWSIIDATHIDDAGRILAAGLRQGRCYELLLAPRPAASARNAAESVTTAARGWRVHGDPARL